MSPHHKSKGILLILALLTGFSEVLSAQESVFSPKGINFPKAISAQTVSAKLFQSQLLFTENKGQVTDDKDNTRTDILFTASNDGAKIFLTSTAIHYQFTKLDYPEGCPYKLRNGTDQNLQDELRTQIKERTHHFSVSLAGSNPDPVIRKEALRDYTENFYFANFPQGITNVHAYGRIVYKEVYPGIDWIVYSQGARLKYDFLVHPGADPALIKLKVTDADAVHVTGNGELIMQTSLGEVKEAPPISFNNGEKVATHFIQKDGLIHFSLGAYDRNKDLVIDPTVSWATYYGGNNTDMGNSCAVDRSGNSYITGSTQSTSGIAAGGFQTIGGGSNSAAYLVKFDSLGNRLWATYYGGTSSDAAYSCTTDYSGNVYICGSASSHLGFGSSGSQNSFGGGTYDAFLVKFSGSGARLWATYYGGNGDDFGCSCAVDGSDNVFLAGITGSTTGIASSSGLKTTFGGGARDAFLVKFNGSGTRLWATYYGDAGDDEGHSCAPDAEGDVYMVGITSSASGIASGGFQNVPGGNVDAFLVKFSSSGARIWATYYGGHGIENAGGCAVDNNGNVYISGDSDTAGLASGGFQNTYGGGYKDAFLVQFNSSGSRQWATYYGGSGADMGYGCAVDGNSNVYMTGYTESGSNIASGGFQNTYGGGYKDAFLVSFNSLGIRKWATYLGGDDDDRGASCATDNFGNLFLAGNTLSTSGIATSGFQNTFAGGYYDAFLVKVKVNPRGEGIVGVNSNWMDAIITYPNPVRDHISIRAEVDATYVGKPIRVDLTNNIGQIVFTTNTKPLNKQFSFIIPINNSLSNGLYQLQFTGIGMKAQKTIVISR